MAADGIAAVQARIAQIQALASGATGTSAAAVSSSAAASPQFAQLLQSAMGSSAQGIGTDPTGGGLGGLGGTDPSSLMSQIAQLAGGATGTTGSTTGSAPMSGAAQKFVTDALAQRGKPYQWGAETKFDDPNPSAFDCSELVEWAAHRAGTYIPDGANAQYVYVRDHGGAMSVDQALHTPGALLFHFGHEPKNVGDNPSDSHVAISLGDGVHTIEARGRKYGTNVFDATGVHAGFFNYAGMIPGMH